MRTKLPELNRETKDGVNEAARDRDSLKKELGKQYTDSHRHAKESSVTVGDEVLLQQRKQDKFSTHFEPVPYKVVEKTGSQVTIQSKTAHRTNETCHTQSHTFAEVTHKQPIHHALQVK